jgi:hypothetical protein
MARRRSIPAEKLRPIDVGETTMDRIMLKERPMETCEVCSAKVGEVRRGRCWSCYARWAAARPVGLGAACCMCGEGRRAFLRSVELLGSFVPACHNCAARAIALEPMPGTLAEIRAQLRRERRLAPRRFGKVDGRVFPRDRRGVDRRIGRVEAAEIDDEMIIEIVEELGALAPLHHALDASELTGIHAVPVRPGA